MKDKTRVQKRSVALTATITSPIVVNYSQSRRMLQILQVSEVERSITVVIRSDRAADTKHGLVDRMSKLSVESSNHYLINQLQS